jgi:hypothetical protein
MGDELEQSVNVIETSVPIIIKFSSVDDRLLTLLSTLSDVTKVDKTQLDVVKKATLIGLKEDIQDLEYKLSVFKDDKELSKKIKNNDKMAIKLFDTVRIIGDKCALILRSNLRLISPRSINQEVNLRQTSSQQQLTNLSGPPVQVIYQGTCPVCRAVESGGTETDCCKLTLCCLLIGPLAICCVPKNHIFTCSNGHKRVVN